MGWISSVYSYGSSPKVGGSVGSQPQRVTKRGNIRCPVVVAREPDRAPVPEYRRSPQCGGVGLEPMSSRHLRRAYGV